MKAMSPAEAKQRGLVPKSGDWNLPYRWIKDPSEHGPVHVSSTHYNQEEISEILENKVHSVGVRKYVADNTFQALFKALIPNKRPELTNYFPSGRRVIPRHHIDKLGPIFLKNEDGKDMGDNFHEAAHVEIANGNRMVIFGLKEGYKRHNFFNDLMNTFVHELGHCIANKKNQIRPWIWARVEHAFAEATEKKEGFISNYSKVNVNEFFAENYKAYITATDALKKKNSEMFDVMEILHRTPDDALEKRPLNEEEQKWRPNQKGHMLAGVTGFLWMANENIENGDKKEATTNKNYVKIFIESAMINGATPKDIYEGIKSSSKERELDKSLVRLVDAEISKNNAELGLKKSLDDGIIRDTEEAGYPIEDDGSVSNSSDNKMETSEYELEKQFRVPPVARGQYGMRNYRLMPFTVMIHRKGKAPYFSTRWKKVEAPSATGSNVHIIPVENYKGDMNVLYNAWKGYINSFNADDYELLMPLIALQEIIYKGLRGILVAQENRIIGVCSVKVEETGEARISTLSASPYDIKNGHENKIEDSLKAGIKKYAEYNELDLKILNDVESIEKGFVHIMNEINVVKQAPPGPPPRRGLVWKPSTHRWIRPDTGEEWESPAEGQKFSPAGQRLIPGWTNVWVAIDPKQDLQAFGKDQADHGQQLMSKEYWKKRDPKKHKKVKSLHKDLPMVMKKIETDMAKGNQEAKVLFLIALTGARVDSGRKTSAKVKAYGASSLLVRHVKIKNSKNGMLDYIGKHGVHIKSPISDTKLIRMLQEQTEGKGPEDSVFDSKYGRITKYFKGISEGKPYTPKDLRGLMATSTAIQAIKKIDPPTSEKEYKTAVKQAAIAASNVLGNDWEMALDSYIDPIVFIDWQAQLAQRGIIVSLPTDKKKKKKEK